MLSHMLPSHPCKAPPRRDHLCAALHRPSCLCPHPQTGSTAGHSASTAHVSPLFQEQKHSWNTSQVSCRTTQNTGFLHIHTNEVYSSSDLFKKNIKQHKTRCRQRENRYLQYNPSHFCPSEASPASLPFPARRYTEETQQGCSQQPQLPLPIFSQGGGTSVDPPGKL